MAIVSINDYETMVELFIIEGDATAGALTIFLLQK